MATTNQLRRILLVEDSENDVKLTLRAFAAAKLANDVVVVRDGQAALDYLSCQGAYVARSDGPPAVVLLDIKLPKLNGLQVLARVKQDANLKEIPVVMLTSSAVDSDVTRSYGLGVNAYVVKPVAFDEFMAAIKELGLFWGVVNEPPRQALRAPE